LTPDRVLSAVREVTAGISFCLSLPLDLPGGNVGNARRHPPKLIAAVQDGVAVYNRSGSQTPGFKSTGVVSDDAVLLYTQYSTQWDSFAHIGAAFDADDDGEDELVYYNGWRAGETVVSPTQNTHAEPWAQFENPHAHELGIDRLAETGVQGRGVLVDLHALFGRERRYVGYDDLMRAMDASGAVVEAGDMLLLYTGFDQVILEAAGNPTHDAMHGTCSGLDGCDDRLLQWITDTGIAAIACDNRAVELLPATCVATKGLSVPLHHHCLFKLGIPLGEQWFLRDLAAWLRVNKRTRFLLTAPPLRLPGAVGSPVTPVATV
jgi:kynurenine formamidase